MFKNFDKCFSKTRGSCDVQKMLISLSFLGLLYVLGNYKQPFFPSIFLTNTVRLFLFSMEFG